MIMVILILNRDLTPHAFITFLLRHFNREYKKEVWLKTHLRNLFLSFLSIVHSLVSSCVSFCFFLFLSFKNKKTHLTICLSILSCLLPHYSFFLCISLLSSATSSLQWMSTLFLSLDHEEGEKCQHEISIRKTRVVLKSCCWCKHWALDCDVAGSRQILNHVKS